MPRSILAAIAALLLANAAVPAQAQDDRALATRFQPPSPAPSEIGVTASEAKRGSDLALRHRLRLDLSRLSDSDLSADDPKFGLELGYGASAPPQIGSTARTALPKEFWGRNGQESVRAVLGVPF